MSEPIPLRELIESEIRGVRAEIKHEKELRARAEEAAAAALEKQAVEYERRLTLLSHEQAITNRVWDFVASLASALLAAALTAILLRAWKP